MKTTARAPRRRVRPQRLEDVHHERRPRGLDGRLRQDRSGQGSQGHLGVRRPDGHARASQIEKHLDKMGQRSTDTSAFALTDVVVPGGEPARRGGRGLQDRDEDARLHAPGHRRRRRRRRAGRLRARRRVREGARHVRRADRDAPGRQLPDRGHGDRDRGGAPARVAGGVAARPGRARDARSRRSRSGSPPTRR